MRCADEASFDQQWAHIRALHLECQLRGGMGGFFESNKTTVRYNTHTHIYICICGIKIYIYIYRGCTKPCTSWYRKYSHIQIDQCCQHANWFPYLVHQPKTWDTSDKFGRTAFAAGWFLCYCRAGKGGGRPKFLLNFSPSLQSFSEIRKGQERSFKNFVFSSISFMICIGYRLTSTSHTRELRRPFVYINAALGCFGMGNPTKIAIIHHPAAW